MADCAVLTPGQEIKPKLDEDQAIDLVNRLYGLTVMKIRELNAYDDKNYHVVCGKRHVNPYVTEISEHGYVLKILNSLDSRNVEFVEAQNEMMIYLSKQEIRCTVPVKNLRDSFNSVETLESGSNQRHVIRLLIYQPGLTLHSVPITMSLLRDVGNFAARLDAKLANFSHPVYENRESLWILSAVPKLRDFVYALENKEDREMIMEIVETFEKKVLSVVDELDRGIIHGDLNEQNLLVDPEGTRVDAVIDFGDSHKACLIYELAIAICYMIIQARDVNAAKFVIDGFQSVRKLTLIEKRILKICVSARLSQSLTLGAYSHTLDPHNQYLLVTQKPGWNVLRKLWPLDDETVFEIWGLDNS